MKPIKITGIKKAMSDYNNNHKRLHCYFMCDTLTGEVWVDMFPDENSYNNYNAPSVKAMRYHFCDALQCEHYDLKINMQALRKTAEYMILRGSAL